MRSMFTTPEAGLILGLPTRTVRSEIRALRLEAEAVGGRLLVPRSAIEARLSRGPQMLEKITLGEAA